MSFTKKRACSDSVDESMNESESLNDSFEKRIKRISVEGNIGECFNKITDRS